ncbi:MAG TPA: hypothetical protein VF168_10230 [Trueperaceae bacterium]
MDRRTFFKTLRGAVAIGLCIGLISSAAWLAAPEEGRNTISGLVVGIGFGAALCLGLRSLRKGRNSS